MSNDPRRLTTEEERERLFAARYRGGLCALCGRMLGDGETVYWEYFLVGTAGSYTNRPKAPVGAECVSPWILAEKEHEDPERCVGCGRPVYYSVTSVKRRRAVCSTRCQIYVGRAGRSSRAGLRG